MVDIVKLYEQALTNRKPRGRPARGCKLTIDDAKVRYVVRQWDANREELRNATIVNFFTSSEHIAWLVYEWHWRMDVPDDVWTYFVKCVETIKEEIRTERREGRNPYDNGVRIHDESF